MASRRTVVAFSTQLRGIVRRKSGWEGDIVAPSSAAASVIQDTTLSQKRLSVRVPAQHEVVAPDLRARGNEAAKVFVRDNRWGYCTRDETGRLNARFDFTTEMAATHHLEAAEKAAEESLATLNNNRKILRKYSALLGENNLGVNDVLVKILIGNKTGTEALIPRTQQRAADGFPVDWQQKNIAPELHESAEQVAAALSRHMSPEARAQFYEEVAKYIESPFQNSKTRDYFLKHWLARDTKVAHGSVMYRMLRPMLGITDTDLEKLATIDARTSDAIHVVTRPFNVGISDAKRKSDRSEMYWVVPPQEVVEACHEHSPEAARVIELECDLGLEMETVGLAKAKSKLILSHLVPQMTSSNVGELDGELFKSDVGQWVDRITEPQHKELLEQYLVQSPFQLESADATSIRQHFEFLHATDGLPKNPLSNMSRTEIAKKAKELKAIAWPGQDKLGGALLRKAYVLDTSLSTALVITGQLKTEFIIEARSLVEHMRGTTSWADRLHYHISLNEDILAPGEVPSAETLENFLNIQHKFAEQCCLDQSSEFLQRLQSVFHVHDDALSSCAIQFPLAERLTVVQQHVEDGLVRVANAPNRVWREGYSCKESGETLDTPQLSNASGTGSASAIHGPPSYSDLVLGSRSVSNGQLEWLGRDGMWYPSADAATRTWYADRIGARGTFIGEVNLLLGLRKMLYAADQPKNVELLHESVKPESRFQAAVFAARAVLLSHPDPERSRAIVHEFVSNLWPFGMSHVSQNQYRNQQVDKEEKIWLPTSRDDFIESLRKVVDNQTATQLSQWGVPALQHVTPELIDKAYAVMFHQSLGSSLAKHREVAKRVMEMEEHVPKTRVLPQSSTLTELQSPPILAMGLSEEEYISKTVVLSKIPNCLPKDFLRGVLEKRFGKVLAMEWHNESTVMSDRIRHEQSRVLSLLRKYFNGRGPKPKKRDAVLHRAVLRTLASQVPSLTELHHQVGQQQKACEMAQVNAKQCEIDTEILWHEFKDKWNKIIEQGNVDPRTVFDATTPQVALRDMDRRSLLIADNMEVSNAMTIALNENVATLSWMWDNLRSHIITAIQDERRQQVAYQEEQLMQRELDDMELGIENSEGYHLEPHVLEMMEPMENWNQNSFQPEHLLPRSVDELCDLRSQQELMRVVEETLGAHGPMEFERLPKGGRHAVLREVVPLIDAYLAIWQETLCMQAVVDEKLVDLQELMDEQRSSFRNVNTVAPVGASSGPFIETAPTEEAAETTDEWLEDEPAGPRAAGASWEEQNTVSPQEPQQGVSISPYKMKRLSPDSTFQFAVATTARAKFLNRQLVLTHKWTQEASRGDRRFKKVSHDETLHAPKRILQPTPDEVQLDCGTYAHVVFEDPTAASKLIRKVNLMFGLSVSVPVRYLAQGSLSSDSPDAAFLAGKRDIRIPVPKSEIGEAMEVEDSLEKSDKRSEFSHFALKVSSPQDETTLRVCALPGNMSDQAVKERLAAILGERFSPKDRVRVKRPKDAVGGNRVAEIRFHSLNEAAAARLHLCSHTLGGQPMIVGWKHDARKFKRKFKGINGDVENMSAQATKTKRAQERMVNKATRLSSATSRRAKRTQDHSKEQIEIHDEFTEEKQHLEPVASQKQDATMSPVAL